MTGLSTSLVLDCGIDVLKVAEDFSQVFNLHLQAYEADARTVKTSYLIGEPLTSAEVTGVKTWGCRGVAQ